LSAEEADYVLSMKETSPSARDAKVVEGSSASRTARIRASL